MTTLRDKAVSAAVDHALVSFPASGAYRVHPEPATVYQPTQLVGKQAPGPNRFDDPEHCFSVRYLADHLRVCLLEVMARFRTNLTAEDLINSVNVPSDMQVLYPSDPKQVDGVRFFLLKNRAARFVAPASKPAPRLVDVFNIKLLAALDQHHRIRPLLVGPNVVAAQGDSAGVVHLDGSLIRNANANVGRPVTQEISRLLLEILNVQGLRYESRHSSNGEAVCWALRGDLVLETAEDVYLNPLVKLHRDAVQDVAHLYNITLPDEWVDYPSKAKDDVQPSIEPASSAPAGSGAGVRTAVGAIAVGATARPLILLINVSKVLRSRVGRGRFWRGV